MLAEIQDILYNCFDASSKAQEAGDGYVGFGVYEDASGFQMERVRIDIDIELILDRMIGTVLRNEHNKVAASLDALLRSGK